MQPIPPTTDPGPVSDRTLRYVAAGLLAGIGLLGLGLIAFDEISGRTPDVLTISLITFILGVVSSLLNLNAGYTIGRDHTRAVTAAQHQQSTAPPPSPPPTLSQTGAPHA